MRNVCSQKDERNERVGNNDTISKCCLMLTCRIFESVENKKFIMKDSLCFIYIYIYWLIAFNFKMDKFSQRVPTSVR